MNDRLALLAPLAFLAAFLPPAGCSSTPAPPDSADAHFAAAHYNLGTMHLHRGDSVAAAMLLERAVELDPADARAFVNLGTAYYECGLAPLALGAFEEALRLEPGHHAARLNVARLVGELDPGPGIGEDGE